MSLLPLVLLGATALLGCSKALCDAEGVADGAVQARVDDVDWTGATAQWSWAGDGAQITTADSNGWRLTLAAKVDAAGTAMAEVLVDGAEVEVPMGDGNLFIAYPSDSATSYTANEAGAGELVLVRDGDVLSVCFDATAAAADGSEVVFAEGVARATCALAEGCD